MYNCVYCCDITENKDLLCDACRYDGNITISYLDARTKYYLTEEEINNSDLVSVSTSIKGFYCTRYLRKDIDQLAYKVTLDCLPSDYRKQAYIYHHSQIAKTLDQYYKKIEKKKVIIDILNSLKVKINHDHSVQDKPIIIKLIDTLARVDTMTPYSCAVIVLDMIEKDIDLLDQHTNNVTKINKDIKESDLIMDDISVKNNYEYINRCIDRISIKDKRKRAIDEWINNNVKKSYIKIAKCGAYYDFIEKGDINNMDPVHQHIQHVIDAKKESEVRKKELDMWMKQHIKYDQWCFAKTYNNVYNNFILYGNMNNIDDIKNTIKNAINNKTHLASIEHKQLTPEQIKRDNITTMDDYLYSKLKYDIDRDIIKDIPEYIQYINSKISFNTFSIIVNNIISRIYKIHNYINKYYYINIIQQTDEYQEYVKGKIEFQQFCCICDKYISTYKIDNRWVIWQYKADKCFCQPIDYLGKLIIDKKLFEFYDSDMKEIVFNKIDDTEYLCIRCDQLKLQHKLINTNTITVTKPPNFLPNMTIGPIKLFY